MSNEKINTKDKVRGGSGFLAAGSSGTGIVAQLFPFIFGAVATLLIREYVAFAFAPGQFIFSLVMPRGEFYEQVVPLSILFLFFWTISDLMVKLRGINRQAQFLFHPAIQGSPHRVGASKIDVTIEELQDAPKQSRAGYVFRTVVALLEHLKSANDPQRSHEFFRHQTDLDAEIMSSGYTTVRVFIWAMPILGFIGTVIGISFAVGDFSGFLSGDVDDIDLVKQELANVSTGLSFAFNTTLLGLVASLLAMLLMTYVEGRGDLLTRGVEELCLRIVAHAPHLQSKNALNEVNDMSIESLNAFAEILGNESQRLRDGFDGFNTRFLEVGNRVVDTYSALGDSVEKQADVFAQQMSGLSSQLTGALSSALSAFSETTSAISRDLEGLSPELGAMREAITEGLDRVTQSNGQFEEAMRANTQDVIASQEKLGEKIADGLDRVSQSNGQVEEVLRANTQEVIASQEKLGEKIADGLDRVNQSSGQVEEVLRSNTHQVIASQEKLGEKIDAIRPSHELIVKVSQSLDNSSVALEQVRDVHKTLLPVLEELRGPMEFKMVPAAKKVVRDDE